MKGVRRAGAVVGICVGTLILVAPAAIASDGSANRAVVRTGFVGIGDSIMLSARGELLERGFTEIDAQSGWRASKALMVIGKDARTLPSTVVVHLGTNGTLSRSMCHRITDAAGPARKVYYVTIRSPRKAIRGTNRALRECAADYGDERVGLIDWGGLATARPDLLSSDGIHPNEDGVRAYAAYIAAAVGSVKPAA